MKEIFLSLYLGLYVSIMLGIAAFSVYQHFLFVKFVDIEKDVKVYVIDVLKFAPNYLDKECFIEKYSKYMKISKKRLISQRIKEIIEAENQIIYDLIFTRRKDLIVYYNSITYGTPIIEADYTVLD